MLLFCHIYVSELIWEATSRDNTYSDLNPPRSVGIIMKWKGLFVLFVLGLGEFHTPKARKMMPGPSGGRACLCGGKTTKRNIAEEGREGEEGREEGNGEKNSGRRIWRPTQRTGAWRRKRSVRCRSAARRAFSDPSCLENSDRENSVSFQRNPWNRHQNYFQPGRRRARYYWQLGNLSFGAEDSTHTTSIIKVIRPRNPDHENYSS